jgi:hypothetical protein
MSPAWSSIGVKTCLHLPINGTRIHQLVLHQMQPQLWSTYCCNCGGVPLVSTIEQALICYYRSSKRKTAQWELVKKEKKTNRNKYLQFVTCPSMGRIFLFEICLKSLFVNRKKVVHCTIGTDGSTHQDSYVPLPCSSCDSNWHLSICKQLGKRWIRQEDTSNTRWYESGCQALD